MTETTFRHTTAMGEISGMGGDYERACQDMLETGVKWLQERTKKDLQTKLEMHGYAGVYGVLIADSEDAKALEAVVVAAAKGCTGAMHHAVMSRLSYVAKHGWGAYCAEVLKTEKENDQ